MKITRKVMTLLLISSVIFENNITFVHAAEAEYKEIDLMQEMISDLEKGYSAYYNISDVKTELISNNQEAGYVENLYVIEMDAILKADSVEELDYYQGVSSYCNIATVDNDQLSEAESLHMNALVSKKTDIYNELNEYIGKEQNLVFYMKETYPVDKEAEKIILFENGEDYVTWEEMLPASREELQEEGYARMQRIDGESYSAQKTNLSYSYSYSVADAVSYMTRYTSNPSSCNACGNTGCGHYVDTRKYNPNYTHYASTHNDCANYLSQALSNGGIPEDGTWKPNSSTWINVTNLTGYMTNNGYWSSVTYNVLQKGDILRFKSGSHVVMITSFDGTTYRYSGHTNDRLNTVINPTSSTAYYYRVG